MSSLIKFQCENCQGVVQTDVNDDFVMCGLCNSACHVPKGFQQGVVIDDFVIERLLGKGGMGNVYLAHQVTLDREVALKILHPQFLEDQKFLEDFIYEARSVASLNHPNIVQAYKVGEENGVFFFAMEIVDGHNLNDILNKEGHITEKFTVDIAIEVTNALGYAWEKRQLVHRDIKPENIMITQGGHAKVMDLGLSRRDGDNFDDDDTISGTPQYISPEQILGTEIDIRSDFYSLGATLFHLISGRFVFEAPQLTEMVQMHIQENPPSLKSLKPEISKELSFIVNKLLAKQPENRFQDAPSLVKELQKVRKLLKDQKRGVKHFNLNTQSLKKSHASTSHTKSERIKRAQKSKAPILILVTIIIILIFGRILAFTLSDKLETTSSTKKISKTKTPVTVEKSSKDLPTPKAKDSAIENTPEDRSQTVLPNNSNRLILNPSNYSKITSEVNSGPSWRIIQNYFKSDTNGAKLSYKASSKITFQVKVPKKQNYYVWIVGKFQDSSKSPIFIDVNNKRQYDLFKGLVDQLKNEWTFIKLASPISLNKDVNTFSIRRSNNH